MTVVEELVVRSRERVKAHGEVFTPRHMVDQMLDLVRDDLEVGPGFVDKTFLEPSAGDGNFLVAILRRKLAAIEMQLPRAVWPRESLFAVASIYGIELLEDNHQDAKKAMLGVFSLFHADHDIACGPQTNLHRAAACLVDANIVCGDTLTALTHDGEDIVLSWWDRVPDATDMVERTPFRFASLREDSMLDFTAYDSYARCPIDQVHQQMRAS